MMGVEITHGNLGSSTVNNSSPKCPVCDNTSVMPLCEVSGFKIWRCLVSATDFVWPLPDPSRLKEIYDTVSYFRGRGNGTYADYDKETGAVLPLFSAVLDDYGDDDQGRTVLDIGCAFGTHLGLALQKGWRCFGVEISSYARSVAEERYGNKLFIREHISDLPKQEYDLILMFDVLEHLPDPKSLFRELYEHGAVGPHTQIVITTPNARSCDALANPSGWIYRCPPEHLVFFSAESLLALLREMFFPWARVEGIYPLTGSKCPSCLEEDFPRDSQFSQFSGLLCRSGLFDYPTYIKERFDEINSGEISNSNFKELKEIFDGMRQFTGEVKNIYNKNEKLLAAIKLKNKCLVKKNVELEQAYSDKKSIVDELNLQVSRLNNRLNEVVKQKNAAIVKQATEIGRLNEVVLQKDVAIETQAAEIGRLNEVVVQKDVAIVQQAAEIGRLNEFVAKR